MWTTGEKLTLYLHEIVDNGENSVDIWSFDYPSFYKGDDKKAFEQKVIDHFYYRQIGQETVGRFLHMFRTRVREIMPYYVQLYESEAYMKNIEDPFATVDYTETFRQTSSDSTTGSQEGQSSGTVEGENTNTSETSSETSGTDSTTSTEDKERRFSNTPQGSIDNLDSYMTEASKEDNGSTHQNESASSGSSDSSSSGTSKETSSGTTKLDTTEEKNGVIEHTLTKKGAMGVTTFGHDMIEYRQSFLNIDMMVINDLNCLFLGVY